MSQIFVNGLHVKIEKGLSKPANEKKLISYIIKCVDRNNSKLQAIGPMEMIYFTNDDMKILYECTEIPEEEVMEVIKQVKATGIEAQWSNVGKPFHVLITMCIRYYKIKKKKDMVKTLLLYYGVSIYPSLFFKYFQHAPNQAVMEYTINNLSNKYKIRQIGTMYGTIVDTMEKADDTGESRLVKGDDKDILVYIQDKKTRLNDLFKNISREYYKNHEQQKYMNSDFDNFDEEGYHESNSSMYEIQRLTDKISMRIVTHGPDMKLINVSAKLNQVSVNELRNYISKLITSDNKEDIKTLIECILSLFLFDANNSIDEVRSDKFLNYCLELYKKSNTNNKNIITVKAILDKWLKDVGLLEKTNRQATINSFRKALYTFFIFTIEKSG